MYDSVKGEIVIRRDDPRKLEQTLARGLDLSLEFDPKLGGPYANSALWSKNAGNRGLENAFLEGHGHVDGLIAVVGFVPNQQMRIQAVPDLAGSLTGLDRSLVRSVSGTIALEDVRFIVLRMPIDHFPEEDMTDEELERLDEWRIEMKRKNPVFIFRGLTFNQDRDRQRLAV